jgi:hypothetical protein
MKPTCMTTLLTTLRASSGKPQSQGGYRLPVAHVSIARFYVYPEEKYTGLLIVQRLIDNPKVPESMMEQVSTEVLHCLISWRCMGTYSSAEVLIALP